MSISEGVAPADPFDLSGRVALVTGSTRGIGAGIAVALAGAGATVVLHGRRADAVAKAAEALRGQPTRFGPARVEEVAFEVTDYGAMETAVGALEARLGGVDILVNNAGINKVDDFVDVSLESFEAILATDLTSCFVLTKLLAPGMVERGRGKIINICSVHNKLVKGRVAAYASAKQGLAGLTQVMCASWGGDGIQANGLAPGFIETEMTSGMRSNPEVVQAMVDRTPAGRWGTPADLGGTAVWLASSASDFVSGQIVYVDGGLTSVI